MYYERMDGIDPVFCKINGLIQQPTTMSISYSINCTLYLICFVFGRWLRVEMRAPLSIGNHSMNNTLSTVGLSLPALGGSAAVRCAA